MANNGNRKQDKIAYAPSKHWAAAERAVLLTFDDGPSASSTPLIIDVLARYNISAVFFALGCQIEADGNSDIIRRAISLGHIIGNHSYFHPDLSKISCEEITVELSRTTRVLQLLGVRERLFRPPYVAISQALIDTATKLDLTMLLYNVDPVDWKQTMPRERWIRSAVEQIRRRRHSIVLLHDNRQATAEGLEEFVLELRSLNCTFPPLFCESEADCALDQPWTQIIPGWLALNGLPLYRPELRDE